VNAHIQGGRARHAMLLACLSTVSIVTGCAWGDHRPKVAMDSAAGLYDSASLEYKLDAGQLNLPLAVTRVEGQLVSYDQVPSSPGRDTSVGTLKVQYPHPAGRPGFARARLEITSKATKPGATATAATSSSWSKAAQAVNPKRLWSKTSAGSAEVDEVWEFDVPRAQLDNVVASLNRTGYFDSRQQGSDGVEVVAKVDGKTVKKTWQQVPELNELMLSVRNQGRLVSYQRPAAEQIAGRGATNLAVYEQYDAQDRLAAQTAAGYVPNQVAQAGPVANAYVGQPAGAPPVVPYYPESQVAGSTPGMYPPGTAPATAPTSNVAGTPGWNGTQGLPRQDSVPWRAGSRPAPTMPELQPPGTYPATAHGNAAPPATPNVARQPVYPATSY